MKGPVSVPLNPILLAKITAGLILASLLVRQGIISINGGSGAPSIVQMALRIESHLTGPLLNQYNVHDPDPGFQDVITFWKQAGGGSISRYAQPNNLQCAMYVATVYAMAGHPLPQVYNAVDFWAGYKNRQGWQETAVGSGLPLPGDLMVWSGGAPEDGYPNGIGHVVIVVAVQPPGSNTATPTPGVPTPTPGGNANGSITVAQANDTWNLTTPDAKVPSITQSGVHLHQMELLPDLTVKDPNWSGGVNGLKPLGYIHNSALVHSVVGPPTITADQINTILANAHSPAAGTGQSMYDLGVQSGIDPVFALAFFQHESSFGTTGEARFTKSLGNERCIPDRPCIDEAKPGDPSTGFAQMNDWKDGYQHWYDLIAGPVYKGAGLTTVDQIIPKYAPSSDGNNEAAYIQAIDQAVDQWRSGQ